MISLLPKRANSKTDWGQGRAIDRTRLGHLQKQRLVGLFVRWTLENHYSVCAFSSSYTTPAQPEIHDRQLLRGGPAIVLDDLSRLALAT